MSEAECEGGGPHDWDGDPGEEYCSCCGGQKRLLDKIERLRAEVERLTDALKAEESRILADERLYYPPAAWQVNAILAMEQVGMTSRLYLIQRLLGKKVGIPARRALAKKEGRA